MSDVAAPAGGMPPAPETITVRAAVGVLSVMLGAAMSTLSTRLASFGLADIQGAIGAGFDEGSWITTAYTVGDIAIIPFASWIGLSFSVRRLVVISAACFVIFSLLCPLAPDLPSLLALQFARGLSAGTLIPVTLFIMIRWLPLRWRLYGFGLYSLSSTFTSNISATFEGWITETLSWRFIFWMAAAVGALVVAGTAWGLPREPSNREVLRNGDWFGMTTCALGLGFLSAALDQGNRLDWLGSGLINGLLLAGVGLMVVFVIHELRHPAPLIDLRLLRHVNLALGMVTMLAFRIALLASAYVLPQYLTRIQGYRPQDVGEVLFWVALPQLLLPFVIPTILRFVDVRLLLALGFGLLTASCFMSVEITHDWAGPDFLPAEFIQAVAQPIIVVSVITLGFSVVKAPADGLSLARLVNLVRSFGGTVGIAVVGTLITVREHVHSNLINLNVDIGDWLTDQRTAALSNAVAGRSIGDEQATLRGYALLARVIQREAFVLAYADAFAVIGAVLLVVLLLYVLARPVDVSVHVPNRA
ncbi:DHA2 family efflux MFS transporter permease subunit [Vineibacter terrae]|uniref:DHA2 family efflux MFS transporter permease subunit n=1 Tax=Vineibacter terrae TaxID=2586908 RepID=UPI002E365F86|nr:DHA2 family efflux MFS transporter permease subunit [Vineibacter terrae]HEX2889586.1 DHA2 family efflux MFS transporter permease subunit [Vineibacter terrae]